MSPFWTDVYMGTCTQHGDWSRGTPGGCPTCEMNQWPWALLVRPVDVEARLAALEKRVAALERRKG